MGRLLTIIPPLEEGMKKKLTPDERAPTNITIGLLKVKSTYILKRTQAPQYL